MEIVTQKSLQELQKIPGVGPSIAMDLYSLGINSIKDLVGKNPETLYETLCTNCGKRVDRCVLYVFRCAVYLASNKNPEPRLLKWWNFKY